MIIGVDTLVVLVEAEDMIQAFEGWPGDICVAACLTAEGGCDLIVFHRDERPDISVRIALAFDLEPSSTSFVPPEPGFRARSFSYSDERRLLTLIKADRALLDEAVDYAVNYNYAVEEGLDPLAMVGRSAIAMTNGITKLHKRHAKQKEGNRQKTIVPQFLRTTVINGRSARFSTIRGRKGATLSRI